MCLPFSWDTGVYSVPGEGHHNRQNSFYQLKFNYWHTRQFVFVWVEIMEFWQVARFAWTVWFVWLGPGALKGHYVVSLSDSRSDAFSSQQRVSVLRNVSRADHTPALGRQRGGHREDLFGGGLSVEPCRRAACLRPLVSSANLPLHVRSLHVHPLFSHGSYRRRMV